MRGSSPRMMPSGSSQIRPLRIGELARDERVELAGEQAQCRVAARVLLVEPLDQDHVGDARDVATPVAALRLAALPRVELEDRLDVLHASGNKQALARPRAALEQDGGLHSDLRQRTGTAVILLAYALDQPIARDRIAGIIVPAIALERILSHAVDRLVDLAF